MAMVEIVLVFRDRREVRLGEGDAFDVGETVVIDGKAAWRVEALEPASRDGASVRAICVPVATNGARA